MGLYFKVKKEDINEKIIQKKLFFALNIALIYNLNIF